MSGRRTLASPLGPLQLTARAGALVGLRFGQDGPDAGADDPVLLDAERQLGEYFAGRRRDFDLPLALSGSHFELAVWDAMRRIPFGRTRRYGELAGEIGGIARAVGIACGANPIAIIVPCHRVVGAKGRLTGYSGGQGIDTKAWLLRHELAVPLGDQQSLFPPTPP